MVYRSNNFNVIVYMNKYYIWKLNIKINDLRSNNFNVILYRSNNFNVILYMNKYYIWKLNIKINDLRSNNFNVILYMNKSYTWKLNIKINDLQIQQFFFSNFQKNKKISPLQQFLLWIFKKINTLYLQQFLHRF